MEDARVLRSDIASRFAQEFPWTEIEEAETIEEALKHLVPESGFDVAVSDIRVPWKTGNSPGTHHDVAERLCELGVTTIFITGWRESEDVIDFLRKRTILDPTAIVIEKEGLFLTELCRQIRELFLHIASERVLTLTKQFFGEVAGGPVSGTAPMMQLSGTVNAYWRYLDQPARTHLAERFSIIERDGHGVWISLKD